MKNENLLDTSNPHYYIYTSEEITVEVLGGIRIDVLDRLRVTLKISKGEQSIRLQYHLGTTTPNNTSINAPLTDLVTGLIAGVAGMGGGNLHASPTQLQGISSSIIDPQATDFLTQEQDGANTSLPLAYLNWVLFDNQMNYVASSSGFQQVGGSDTLKQMIQNNLPIDKNGYLYIYVSNSTPNVDVFFDNLQVTHIRGPLTEENHYYPFGLTMAGISNQTLKGGYTENKYRYNKRSELQNKEFADGSGLEMYETQLRALDPQLVGGGRWILSLTMLRVSTLQWEITQFCETILWVIAFLRACFCPEV